jgi:hypothetical protein
MNRPGVRIRRACASLCGPSTMRRFIDPAVADLQAEHLAARQAQSPWRMFAVMTGGYLAIAKMVAIAAGAEGFDGLRGWRHEEREVARKGILVALTIVAVATALVEWNMLYHLVGTATMTISVWTSMAFYLVPSTLVLTVPLGLVPGAAFCVHGVGRRRKLAVGVMTLVSICSLAMAANVAWLTPNANQAFRTLFFVQTQGVQHPPPTRGDNELTWSQHWERRQEMVRSGETRRVREFDADYHLKWEFGTAALPLTALVVVTARSRRWSRSGLILAALISCVAYFILIVASNFALTLPGLPAIVAGWAADGVCITAAIVIACRAREDRCCAELESWPS